MAKSQPGRGTRNRTLRLNPATRAIRHALALGLAMAAGVASAGNLPDPGITLPVDDPTIVHARIANNALIAMGNPAGTSIVVATNGSATGMDVFSYYDDVAIDNAGTVDVDVSYYGNATGIRARSFYADAAVVNAGTGIVSASTDNVYGGTATAIRVGSTLGGASLVNDGDVDASAIAEYGNATAYGVHARGGYYDLTTVTNNGDITSSASTGDGVGWAWGISARGTDVDVDNTGTVTAKAYAGNGYASATSLYARGTHSDVVNTGTITADANVAGDGAARAYAVMAWGEYASSDNSGDLRAYSHVGYGDSVAMGVLSYYSAESSTTNSGSIFASAHADAGTALSMGIRNEANYVGSIENTADGRIDARSESLEGHAFAYGAWINSYAATLDNAGVITAEAIAQAGYADVADAHARAIGVNLQSEDGYTTSVTNAASGEIHARASVHDYGQAYAFGVVSYGVDDGRLTNQGTISADAYSLEGIAVASGNVTVGSFAVTINAGSIASHAIVEGQGFAQSVGSYTTGEIATLINDGTIDATADTGIGEAASNGVQMYGGWNAAYNYGDITTAATSLAGSAGAYGIASQAIFGSGAYNLEGATILAAAHSVVGDAVAKGIYNFAYVYDALVTNAGIITAGASAYQGTAIATGVDNIAARYGQANTTNAGDLMVTSDVTGQGDAHAIGVYSYAFVYGAQVANAGSISASAHTVAGDASATGIATNFYHGEAMVANDGLLQIQAVSDGGRYGNAYATGIAINHEIGKYNFPNSTIVNHGDIGVAATHAGDYAYAGAIGIQVDAMYAAQDNAGTIAVGATTTGAFGKAQAIGTLNFAKYSVDSINDGSILATASAAHGGTSDATGLSDSAVYNTATTVNHGDIGAFATSAFDGVYGGIARATGVYAKANYAALVDNAGSIAAHATADHGTASAVGVTEQAKYDVATLTNQGDIVATADAAYGTAKATAASLNSKYGAETINDGDLVAIATANGDAGSAIATGSIVVAPGAHGFSPGASEAMLSNYGDIFAGAYAAGGQAVAIGARTEGAVDAGASTHNRGHIVAIADAAGGAAFATGSKTWSYYGDVALTNAGDVVADADGGESGYAIATGAIVQAAGSGPPGYHAGYAILDNTGVIHASALATVEGHAWAVGTQVDGELGARVINAGDIVANADAGQGAAQAAGLAAHSLSGDITIDNVGGIAAIANGGEGSVAYGVHMESIGTNALSNTGTIVAAGDGATRIAVYSSDGAIARVDNFGTIQGGVRTGSLDDTLVNHAGGTFLLNDDTIDLGGASNLGNAFANNGDIVVRGATNAIEMGAGNALAFTNAGTIDFLDGQTDDVLAIHGDFAGNGTLRMDASGVRGTADLLLIDGNVADGSVTTIDVDVLDMPTSASSTITLANVTGDSTAGAFVLGQVRYGAGNFLSLAFDTGLSATLDAANATPDVFSLGVTVTGLNDTGTLAASIAPGAQALMSDQVGTWRDRMVGTLRKHGLGLWGRMFQNEGTIDPAIVSSNFGQGGNRAFDQKTFGTEVGVDVVAGDQFAVGALLAKAESHQTLATGEGTSRLSGNTTGLYATWISAMGLYVDASYRWMDFDARLQSRAGDMRGRGNATAFNAEAGYAWTLGNGLAIEPQLQYTRTDVDDLDTIQGGVSAFHSDGGTSSIGRLGVTARKAFGAGTVWTPYASLNAVREFDGRNAYSVNDVFFGATSTQGTSALAEGGVEVRLGDNLTIRGTLSWQDGGAMQSFFGGRVGMRVSW